LKQLESRSAERTLVIQRCVLSFYTAVSWVLAGTVGEVVGVKRGAPLHFITKHNANTMNFKERLDVFRRIDALIRRKGTGTPKQLSERLETSEKTTYRYLEQLRTDYDAPLRYCRERQTYYYDNEDFKLHL
jgi:hypothetical protein